jgi:hypothetical protein
MWATSSPRPGPSAALRDGGGDGGPEALYTGARRADALASRALALELVEMSGEQEGAAGIWSGGKFFPFPDASIG